MFRLTVRDRVHLAIMAERHAEAIYSTVDQDREHLRVWLPWVDESKSSEYTLQFIRSSLEQFAHNDGFSAAIWVDGQVAGGIGFHKVNWLNRKVEMGYWISTRFEGQGIVTDCSRALVDYAFREWKLNRVEIHCATGNPRSAAVAKRLGFTLEGTLREAQLLHGKYHDLHIFGMLAREWENASSQRQQIERGLQL
jgi:ribosomal-protein-serine acetyltransferase